MGTWRFLIFLLGTATYFFTTGCNGSNALDHFEVTPEDTNGKNAAQQMSELESVGSIPQLERTSTVAGIDADSNGVRDDVDSFINRTYSTAPQRAAALQFARGMQSAMLVDTTNITKVKEANQSLSRANHCLYSKFDSSGGLQAPALVGSQLESVSTNTKQRLLAYLAFSKALNGTSWAMPNGDTCE